MTHRHPITHVATALALAACAALATPPADAALVARSLDGDATTVEAYHDTSRGITWLRDANALADAYGLAATMGYAAATAALASFNADPTLNYGHGGWRLPDAAGVHIVGGAGCQFGTNGTTDCGDNVDVASSELAHLFHVLLGNLSWRDTTGAVRPGVAGIDWGLVDTGDFDDLDAVGYWSRTTSYRLVFGIAQPGQVVFQMNTGSQTINSPGALNAAWLVHDGDIGTAVVEAAVVPAPGSLALLAPGLLALGLARPSRRRGA